MQDWDLENQLATQRYQQALAARQKQSQMPTGNMVGNTYVKASPFEYLAEGLRSYNIGKEKRDAEQGLKDLQAKRQEAETRDMGAFVNALRGTPARDAVTLPEDQAGPVMPAQAAVAGNPMDAYSIASQSQSPMMRQLGLKGTMDLAEKMAVKQESQAQNQKYLGILSNTANATDAIKAGVPYEAVKNYYESKNLGRDEVKYEDVGGKKVPVTKYGDTPAGVQSLTMTGNPFKDRVVLGPDGKTLVTNTPLVNAESQIRKAGASNVSINTGQRGLDNTLKLRGDFRSEPIYKAHSEVQSAYSQIGAGLKAGTPVGDLTAATKIMKLLDPGSVVRESELGMATAATGLQDRLSNYAQNVISGNKLTPKQRIEFQQLANDLFNESSNIYNAKRTEYQGIADRNQLNVMDVVGNPSKNINPKPDGGMPSGDAIAAEIARRNGGAR